MDSFTFQIEIRFKRIMDERIFILEKNAFEIFKDNYASLENCLNTTSNPCSWNIEIYERGRGWGYIDVLGDSGTNLFHCDLCDVKFRSSSLALTKATGSCIAVDTRILQGRASCKNLNGVFDLKKLMLSGYMLGDTRFIDGIVYGGCEYPLKEFELLCECERRDIYLEDAFPIE